MLNTLAKGNSAMERHDIYEYRNMPEQYNSCYHRRSIAESIISSEKRRLGTYIVLKEKKNAKDWAEIKNSSIQPIGNSETKSKRNT